MLTLVRAVGALAFLLVPFVLLSVVSFFRAEPLPPHGIRLPGLAVEFVSTPEQAEGLLGARGGATDLRGKLRGGLYGDYVFIAAYWLLFMGTSVVLATRDLTFRRLSFNPALWLGVAAALCATSAAIFDVVENSCLAALLDAERVTQPLLDNASAAGALKWTMCFTTLFLLSFTFIHRGFDATLLLGVLYMATAILGFVGLRTSPWVVEKVFFLLALGFIAVAVLFTFRADDILRRH